MRHALSCALLLALVACTDDEPAEALAKPSDATVDAADGLPADPDATPDGSIEPTRDATPDAAIQVAPDAALPIPVDAGVMPSPDPPPRDDQDWQDVRDWMLRPRYEPGREDCTNRLSSAPAPLAADPERVLFCRSADELTPPVPMEAGACRLIPRDAPLPPAPYDGVAGHPPREVERDAAGRVVMARWSSGASLIQVFDGAGRLTLAEHRAGDGRVREEHWAYDAAGRLVRVWEVEDGAWKSVDDHRYDEDGRYLGFLERYASDEDVTDRWEQRFGTDGALTGIASYTRFANVGSHKSFMIAHCLFDGAGRLTERYGYEIWPIVDDFDFQVDIERALSVRVYDCNDRLALGVESSYGQWGIGGSGGIFDGAAYGYDGAGRMVVWVECLQEDECSHHEPIGYLRRFDYDEQGNLVREDRFGFGDAVEQRLCAADCAGTPCEQ